MPTQPLYDVYYDRVLCSYHTAPCAPKLVRSVYLPAPSPFFFLLLWKRQISLLACHWSAVKKALDVGRFFSEKLNFFQLEKTLRAAEKDAGGGVLKSAQDFFENTVYSIGL